MGLNDEIGGAVHWDTAVVESEDTLRTVIGKFVDSCSSALVVKRGETVLGVVTDIDLMESIVRGDDLDSVKVGQFMTACELITAEGTKSPCAQLDESESVENALKVMSAAGVHNLLVSGTNRTGMVSIRDLLKYLIK
ncbi:MAG: CBS domain-containing protein [Desulfobulbaceae bacterium]|nr:CBS domain-containing protein [Desulfobulbaceae bacterium]